MKVGELFFWLTLALCTDSSYFGCFDGRCYSSASRCDGDFDCSDGSDEVACSCELCTSSCTDTPFTVVFSNRTCRYLRIYIYKERKNIYKMNKKVGMLLQKSTDTRGVGISSMRKSIYLLKTTPSSHTHRFHPLPLATPTSCSPHPYIPPTLHNCHPYFELCTS